MGGCICSNDLDEPRSPLIAASAEGDTKKMLLLGASSAGKSTFIKQMQLIFESFEEGGLDEYLMQWRKAIHTQIIRSMKLLSDHSLGVSAQHAYELTSDIKLDCIKSLWSEKAIKLLFDKRVEQGILIPDSSAYFWDEIDRIQANDYIPSEDDILHCSQPTKGVTQYRIAVDLTTSFELWDVGGAYQEKHLQWIHAFKDVDVLLFVVSLSSFDEVCVNQYGEPVNAMQDSLELFETVMNSEWFRISQCNVILLFNKIDLFKEKLRRGCSLKTCFDNYNCPDYIYLHGTGGIPIIMNYARHIGDYANHIVPMDVITLIVKYISFDEKYSLEKIYYESLEFIKHRYESLYHDTYGSAFSLFMCAVDDYNVRKTCRDIQYICSYQSYDTISSERRLVWQ
eukprot:6112_1